MHLCLHNIIMVMNYFDKILTQHLTGKLKMFLLLLILKCTNNMDPMVRNMIFFNFF